MQVSDSITRKSASNLALAFVLLPKEKRQGMSALYAFCREVDDIADEDSAPMEARREELQKWRHDIHMACNGGEPTLPVIRELQPFIIRYRLPYDLFDELLRGVEMDLEVLRYPSYEQLDQYCYRVASVVGLLSIEIFGYSDLRCRQYAVDLGKALQLTNILRDVRDDAERGRIYIPQSELARYGVAEQDILEFRYSPRFFNLAQSVAERARQFYRAARLQLPESDRRSMASAELMGTVYWRILQKLEQGQFSLFAPRPARLSNREKIFLIIRTWLRLLTGATAPNYGICSSETSRSGQ